MTQKSIFVNQVELELAGQYFSKSIDSFGRESNPGPFDCPSSGARYLRVSERASVTVATIWRSVADYYPNYCNDQTYLLLI